MHIRYPHTLMVNKENYYQEYKGYTKWLSLISSHFKKKVCFGMTLLHAHAHYICIVCAKYQKGSVQALLQVDSPVYALSKHKLCYKLTSLCMHHDLYLIGNRNKSCRRTAYSPELSFANKTKMFFIAKKKKRRKITGPWNIGHCDWNLFWGQTHFPKVWHSSIKY